MVVTERCTQLAASLDSRVGGTSDRSDTLLGETARVDPVYDDEPENAVEWLQMDEDLSVTKTGRAQCTRKVS